MKKLYYLLLALFILMLFSCVQPPTTPETPPNLTPDGSPLRISSVNPTTFSNDKDSRVTITGTGFITSTAFFVQSTKLEIVSLTRTQAIVIVPKRFLPSVYGIMVADNTGSRATLYPAFTITQAASTRAIDEEINYLSFVEGYVIDHDTQQPIPNAIVGIPGLETTTNSSGYYLLRGVPTGRQALEIRKQGYEPLYRIAEVPVSSNGQTLTMKLSELEPKSTRVTMIGSSGGTHYASADGEAGPFLKIPAGALDSNTPIQFTHLRTANTLPELPQDGYYLAFAHLGPTGLVFKKPATLFLPLQDGVTMPVGTPINISYFDSREAKWVDDITNGKISRVNGKLFLEYEINHFTWIGGQWLPDPVEGRIVNQNGYPLSGMTTNWGVTNATGYFKGTTTQSNVNRPISTSVILPDGTKADCPALDYSGRQAVSFPNCVVQLDRDQVPTITPLQGRTILDPTNEITPFGAPSPLARSAIPENPLTDCDAQLCSEDGVPILTQPLKNASYDIELAQLAKVQLHTLRFFTRDGDVTPKVRVTTSNNGDSIKVSYTPFEPLRPDGEDHPFTIKGKYLNKDGDLIDFQRYQSVKSVAQFKTANLAVTVLPDSFVPIGVNTPFATKVPQGVLWIARQADILGDGSVKDIYAEVRAYNATGQIINNFNTLNYVYFSDPSVGNTARQEAQFKNGKARIPIKVFPFKSNDPDIDIRGDNITRVLLSKIKFSRNATDNTGVGVRPQAVTTENEIKVLPLAFSGIADPAVAKKSPSMGAKSVSFWSKVGDWFSDAANATGTWVVNTVDGAVKDPTQVALFALGMAPIAGGAIDCGKGYYNFFTNQPVDLLETEMGCVGMTLDALISAATLAGQLQVTATYPILKPVLYSMKVMNNVSKGLNGATRTALKKVFERLRNTSILDVGRYRDEAFKLIDRLVNAKFAKGVIDEGGETAAKKYDEMVEEVLESCQLPFSPRSAVVKPQAAPIQCGLSVDDYWDLANKAGNSMGDALRSIDADLGRPTRALISTSTQMVIDSWIGKYRLNASRLSSSLGFTDAEEFGLKQLENFGKAIDTRVVASGTYTEWISPAGIKYGLDTGVNGDKTRVLHVLLRHGQNSTDPTKSKFIFEDFQIFDVIDEAYTRGLSGNPSPIFNPARPNNMCIDLGRVIGNDRNGNPVTGILFGLVQPNASPIPAIPEIRTVFPSVC